MSQPDWPTVEAQLAAHHVPHGSALERLIRDNQDFHLLRPDEASDRLGLPLWLRVYWRKHHPELEYRADDPTGGYPRALRNLYTWMVANPDLYGGPAPPSPPHPLLAVADVGPNRRVSGVQTSPRSESDVRIHPSQLNQVIAASNTIDTTGTQSQFFSSNGGTSWAQTTLPLVSSDNLHSDPAVGWTTDGTAWAITIGIQGGNLRLRAYRSSDGGATWAFDGTVSGGQTATDKEMMWVDTSAISPLRNNIYVIWHNGSPVFVNRRTGPAGSWQTPVQISGAETTGTGIGGDITTNTAGEVFAFWPDTGSRRLFVARSGNGGASFGAPTRIATTFAAFDIGVPSFASRRALIYVSGAAYRDAATSFVYAVWTDLSGATGCTSGASEPDTDATSMCKSRIWFARSAAGGTSWDTPIMLNNSTSRNDQFNPRLAVDDNDGTLTVIYYDTFGDATRLKTNIWYQSSSDNGTTWTSAVKVSSGQTDETSAGADSGNQYGDYNGLSGRRGIFVPSWTDRRGGGFEEIWTSQLNPDSVTDLVLATSISQQ